MIIALLAVFYKRVLSVVMRVKQYAMANKAIAVAVVLAVVYLRKNIFSYVKMVLKFVEKNLEAVKKMLLKNRLVTLVVVGVVGYFLYKKYQPEVQQATKTTSAAVRQVLSGDVEDNFRGLASQL